MQIKTNYNINTHKKPAKSELHKGNVLRRASFKGIVPGGEIKLRYRQFSHSLLDSAINAYSSRDENFLAQLIRKFSHRIPKEYYNLFVQNQFKLTEYDTPFIIRARKILTRHQQRSISENTQNTIFDKHLQKAENYPKQNQAIIVTGLPGGGKSTHIKRSGLLDTHYQIDIDEIRANITEMQNNAKPEIIKHQLFHNAAVNIFKNKLGPTLTERGTNVILPTAGIVDSIKILTNWLKAAGYKTGIIHVHVDTDKAIGRGIQRAKSEKLFYDPLFAIRRERGINSIQKWAESCNDIEFIKKVNSN